MAAKRKASVARAADTNGRSRAPKVLILSGGAPHAALLAGALCAVYRAGKTFDVIWASGGGGLIALLFAAPKVRCADEALRGVVEFGVSDSIYRWFPMGYKTFFKVGPFARPFRQIAQLLKVTTDPHPFPDVPKPEPGPGNQSRRRLYNDAVDLGFSALTPTTFPFSTGLCEPLPFLEDTVDFHRANKRHSPSGFPVNGRAPWFYLNALNLRTCKIEQFETGELSPATIRAALAFPFVYPAQEINGQPYSEGAQYDPINLPKLDEKARDPASKLSGAKFYVFDILGSLEKELLQPQRSLWGAFGLSLVVPVASLAVKCLELWDPEYKDEKDSPNRGRVYSTAKATYVSFEIPRGQKGRILEWRHENASALFDAGFESGKALLRTPYGRILPNRLDRAECPPPSPLPS